MFSFNRLSETISSVDFLKLLTMKLFKHKSMNRESLNILQATNQNCLNIDLVDMDFILRYGLHHLTFCPSLTLDRLEQKCLGHVFSVGDDFSGHILTMHGGLLAYAPPNIQPGTSWEVPTSEIHSLLWCSPCYPGELTPIQVWKRVKATPGF